MHPDGTYDIKYDDGDKEGRVPAPMVRPFHKEGSGGGNEGGGSSREGRV